MKVIFRHFFFIFLAFLFLEFFSLFIVSYSYAQENKKCTDSNYLFCQQEMNAGVQKQNNSILLSSELLKTESKKEEQKPKKIQKTTFLNISPSSFTNPLNPDIIFNLVNDYRAKLGLTVFEKEEKLCTLAKSRAEEGHREIFVSGNLHSGLYNRNLPYWITENLIYQKSEERAFNWWLNSPIHRRAILGASKYSCIGCFGNTCSELFTSYTPK
ncbi:MAG: CAP domain-containing protein [Candidatus Levybacteria bacterium]|nr:CAP domain-containing protein [Candidatus Levybacteria bacterium]